MDSTPLRDDLATSRLILETPGGGAFADYRKTEGARVIMHTEVPAALRGQGLGSQLARALFEEARRRGLKIVRACSCVADWVRRHPDLSNSVAAH